VLLVPCPKIIRPPKPVKVRPGETATFFCLAWSFGGLVYEWERNDKEQISSDAMVSFNKWSSSDGTSFNNVFELHLPNVQQSFEANYCCTALNECGQNRSSCAWLEVNGKFWH